MSLDTILSCLAMVVEATILIGLIVLCVRSSRYRKHAIVALGSLAPIAYFYMSAIAAYVRNPTDPGVRFAFYAMWIMGFVFFLVCIGIGLTIGQIRRPTDLKLRFLLGASVTTGLCGLFTLLA